MEIGDSFFETPAGIETEVELQQRMSSGAANWARYNGGSRKFATRIVIETGADDRDVTGVRVWRVKDREVK